MRSLTICVCVLILDSIRTDEQPVTVFLEEHNEKLGQVLNKAVRAAWEYYTNLTAYNQQKMSEATVEHAEFELKSAKMAATYNQSEIKDENIARQLDLIKTIGISILNDTEKLNKIFDLSSEMVSAYSTATWCPTEDDCKYLNPDLDDLFASSRNYSELEAAWVGWRNVSGRQVKQSYVYFTRLVNEAITSDGKFADMGDYLRAAYDRDTLEDDVRNLYTELSPLYQQLHAYVRRKLRQYYGEDNFPPTGHIPAHLLGNMWAQQWNNIYDLLEPYPGESLPSITEEMLKQNYSVRHMFEVGEEFFTSMGFDELPETFWEQSLLERPTDRGVACHPTSWDLFNQKDFRISMCTEVKEEHLRIIQHELGHIFYFIEYNHLPVIYRQGANPGFHEGMAEIATLSFSTPEHLQEIGLLQELPDGHESDINFLFKMALDKVAFLPFGYTMEQWRWKMYRGEITPEQYTSFWWELRCKYQGLSSPVQRTEDDFDPGSKFHIVGDVPYIRYFVSFILQFQWHKALCDVIGYTGPLHRCSIYKSEEAGTRLKEMLKMGASKPWGEAMLKITRDTHGQTDKLNASALLEYFSPLYDWLKAENAKNEEPTGWQNRCPSFNADISAAPGTKVTSRDRLIMFCITLFTLFALL